MASGLTKYTHKYAGYKAVMRSGGCRAMLQAKAEAVQAAAEAQLPADSEIYILADTTIGATRAGATIIGVPMRLEQDRRILGSAIDAAR